MEPVIAVLIPCFNEERAIGQVLRDFKTHLPGAQIYVFDNNSTDKTAEVARAAGAQVYHERWQGKGFVVRRMFAEIDADIYVMADGDGTYDAASAPEMIEAMRAESLDMVVGTRDVTPGVNAYRAGHATGNRMLTGLVRLFFGVGFSDMLSGYRVLSRRFVKSFPALSEGFEIETELTIHCLSMGLPVREVPTPYSERAEGTSSKLRTFRDGLRILLLSVRMLKDFRPLMFFGLISLASALLSIWLLVPVVVEFVETGDVPRFPTAIMSMGLMIVSLLSLTAGFILDSVAQLRLEGKRLAYLAQSETPGPLPSEPEVR